MSLIGNEDGNQPESVINQLVGEGKKFKTVEDALKGKLESDEFIEKLKAENEALKLAQAKQDHAEELLKKLQEKQDAATATPTPEDSPAVSDELTNTPDSTKDVDLEALVEKVLSERDNKTKAQKNIEASNAAVTELYGDKAGEVLKNKAVELGLGVSDLENIAANSATAFLKLIGADMKQQTSSSDTDRSVKTESFNTNPNERDWNYYTKLRKENPSLYNSPEIRKQLYQDQERLGSYRFFNKT